MITISKPYRIAEALQERGFHLESQFDFSGACRFAKLVGGIPQYISWRGSEESGGQFIMARGEVVERWPCPNSISLQNSFQEACSPFFFVGKDWFSDDDESGHCLVEKVSGWLDSAGLVWLSNPSQRSDEFWAQEGVYTGYRLREFWSRQV